MGKTSYSQAFGTALNLKKSVHVAIGGESVKKILTNEDGYVILLVAYRVCEELNAGKDVQRWRMENM